MREGADGAEERFAQELDRALAQEGMDSFSLFLYDLLRTLLRTDQLSLSTLESNPTRDGDFELKQMPLPIWILCGDGFGARQEMRIGEAPGKFNGLGGELSCFFFAAARQ